MVFLDRSHVTIVSFSEVRAKHAVKASLHRYPKERAQDAVLFLDRGEVSLTRLVWRTQHVLCSACKISPY